MKRKRERESDKEGREDGNSQLPCSVILVSDNSDSRIPNIPSAGTIVRVRSKIKMSMK